MSVAQARPMGKQKLTLKDVELVLKRTVEFETYMLQNQELAKKQGGQRYMQNFRSGIGDIFLR